MVSSEQLAQTVERIRAQRTDDSLVEVKACTRGLSSDIWETVSSFANTAGGIIICGLDEKTGFAPAPGFDLDRVRDQFVSGIGDGGQPAEVTHVPRYELSRGMVDGAQVLVIEIRELDIREKPCFITARGVQNGSYKRVDDKDIRFSPSELFEMQSILIPSEADGEIVPEATEEDLDQELVSQVIEHRRRQSPRVLRNASTREQQLTRLNITNKQGGVRLAGLLATGVYPQQYFPKLVIDVAVHPGTRKSEPGKPRFLDRQVCDGPLSACVEDALAVIGRNLRKISVVQGAGRREEWEVPEEVLREALANAVIHREYSPMFVGESVSVDIYPDRIEVTNPGGLWGGKTIETLDNGESRCRNAKLMSLMGAVPLEHAAGYVAESQGSGVGSMIREMESRSLGHPKFVAKYDSFKVILARHGAELEEHRTWLSAHAGRLLEREEEILLSLLRKSDTPLSIGDMRARLGWDSDDIRAFCKRLAQDGLLNEVDDDRFAVAEDAAEPTGARPTARQLRDRVVACMGPGVEWSAQELADHLGVPIARVRYVLPALIKEGRIRATAGTHSRNRRYILV